MKSTRIEASKQRGLKSLFFKELDEQTLDALQPVKKSKKPALSVTVTAGGRTRHIDIHKFPCVIGRAKKEADLICNDQTVSSKHAVIDVRENKIIITDSHSRNGIEVGGLKLGSNTSRQLFQGDVLLLGNAEIKVTKITNPESGG